MGKDYENVKIETELLDEVRALKLETGVSLTAFINKSVKKELEMHKKLKKNK
jgi:post-segregation antitoxin (ccd killing protein)